MNETIQIVLAPLAAFWVAMEGFNKTATFVNGMRDTIMSGVMGSTQLTLHHRQAMFVDWRLSIIGFIVADIIFSAIIFSLAGIAQKVAIGIYGVALSTFLGAILFIICGISDYRAIKHTLEHAKLGTSLVALD